MKILELIDLLADKTKLIILVHLYSCKSNFCNVNIFVEKFRLSKYEVEKALRELKYKNIIAESKQNNQLFYKLSSSFVSMHRDILEKIIREEYSLNKYTTKCVIK